MATALFNTAGESETTRLIETHWNRVGISAVYFPLVAVLLPKWGHVLEEFKSQSSKQIVYLMSGAGIPRNAQHAVSGNSTEITAQLIALFVRQYYPFMEVVQVHSGSNIFRFDDNVQFMIRELRPRLEARRETLVAKCGDAWKAHFHVTIAYADGPPARLSALNASLRVYTPSYLHIWQLKTFWHERKLSMADVDFHAFENIEASPCVPAGKADAMTQRLVREMCVFRDQFLAAEGEGEIAGFWLRKSRKPVLAVLLVERTDPDTGAKLLVAHRGVNCEVSMPTGSLCAERNAIGSALASDPTLRRHALKMIGVLGLNLGGAIAVATVASNGSNRGDQGAGNEQANLQAALREIPLIPLSSAAPSSNTTTDCGGSCAGAIVPSSGDGACSSAGTTIAIIAPITGDADAATGRTEGLGAPLTAHPPPVIAQRSPGADATTTTTTTPALTVQTNDGATSPANGSGSKRARHAENANYSSPRKPKRPRTFSVDESSVESLLREAAAPADRNPLAPCGACKEWLVKIAEANPAFRVVTFENSRCRSVYINQLM